MRGAGALATLTLAIGIGGATTMFGVVYGALLRPPPFVDPDRLVIIFNTRLTPKDGLQRLRWSYPRVDELRRTATSFEAIATATSTSVSVSGHDDCDCHVDERLGQRPWRARGGRGPRIGQ